MSVFSSPTLSEAEEELHQVYELSRINRMMSAYTCEHRDSGIMVLRWPKTPLKYKRLFSMSGISRFRVVCSRNRRLEKALFESLIAQSATL